MNKRNFLKSIPFLCAALTYYKTPFTLFGESIDKLKTHKLGPIFKVEYPCVFQWEKGIHCDEDKYVKSTKGFRNQIFWRE